MKQANNSAAPHPPPPHPHPFFLKGNPLLYIGLTVQITLIFNKVIHDGRKIYLLILQGEINQNYMLGMHNIAKKQMQKCFFVKRREHTRCVHVMKS